MSYVYAECGRCGFRWEIAGKSVKLGQRCESCKAVATKNVQYSDKTCIAWDGDFDDNDRPMQDGKYFLPGVRLCKHRDCVNLEHIAPFN